MELPLNLLQCYYCHVAGAVCSQHDRRNDHLSRFFVNFGACIVLCAAEAWVVLVTEVAR